MNSIENLFIYFWKIVAKNSPDNVSTTIFPISGDFPYVPPGGAYVLSRKSNGGISGIVLDVALSRFFSVLQQIFSSSMIFPFSEF